MPYLTRMSNVVGGSQIRVLDPTINICQNKEQVINHESFYIENGFEGIIIRALNGLYKCGRSTLNEQYLLALKRFQDAEAKVIDCAALERNYNPTEIDHHGHQKRSSSILNKYADDMLGSLLVVGINGKYDGKRFNIGSGFNELQRRMFWELHKKGDWNPIVKYKYFDVGSTPEAPRQPIFLGIRDTIDL